MVKAADKLEEENGAEAIRYILIKDYVPPVEQGARKAVHDAKGAYNIREGGSIMTGNFDRVKVAVRKFPCRRQAQSVSNLIAREYPIIEKVAGLPASDPEQAFKSTGDGGGEGRF